MPLTASFQDPELHQNTTFAKYEAPFHPRPRPVEALYFAGGPIPARYLQLTIKSPQGGTSEEGQHGHYVGLNEFWVLEDPTYVQEVRMASHQQMAWIIASINITPLTIDHGVRQLIVTQIPDRACMED